MLRTAAAVIKSVPATETRSARKMVSYSFPGLCCRPQDL